MKMMITEAIVLIIATIIEEILEDLLTTIDEMTEEIVVTETIAAEITDLVLMQI